MDLPHRGDSPPGAVASVGLKTLLSMAPLRLLGAAAAMTMMTALCSAAEDHTFICDKDANQTTVLDLADIPPGDRYEILSHAKHGKRDYTRFKSTCRMKIKVGHNTS